MIRPCFRGEIYYARLGRGVGSEQAGDRPVLILQNNVGNKFSPTTIIAPISGQIATKANLPTHYHLEPQAGLMEPSVVLLEQIRTIDKHRLEHKLGRLPEHHLRGINRAIKISMGLLESSANMVLCLCSSCANGFYSTGHILRRIDPVQVEKETCTYCNLRSGFDYEVIPKRQALK